MPAMPLWVPEPIGIAIGGVLVCVVPILLLFILGRAIVYFAHFLSWLKFQWGWEMLTDEEYDAAQTYYSDYGLMKKKGSK